MQPLRPAAKTGIVLGGLVATFAAAWVAVDVRQRFQNPADVQAASGMYAAGDAMWGVAVFGVLALLPLGLALFWLRPVPRFWKVLTTSAAAYAPTGPLALLVSGPLRALLGGWSFLGFLRIGTMPLSALALATCGLFAPAVRQRWLLLVAAFLDGALFVGVIVVKFIRPFGR